MAWEKLEGDTKYSRKFTINMKANILNNIYIYIFCKYKNRGTLYNKKTYKYKGKCICISKINIWKSWSVKKQHKKVLKSEQYENKEMW